MSSISCILLLPLHTLYSSFDCVVQQAIRAQNLIHPVAFPLDDTVQWSFFRRHFLVCYFIRPFNLLQCHISKLSR
uniref:Putative secreted protein n=1 Tax=Xenopsylla cheopis TaxID=163159 RepID=A0A6M2DZV4_XENCH